jgi:hypothetical protein
MGRAKQWKTWKTKMDTYQYCYSMNSKAESLSKCIARLHGLASKVASSSIATSSFATQVSRFGGNGQEKQEACFSN